MLISFFNQQKSMNFQKKTSLRQEDQTAIIRLTALWALSEAAMGGVMHLFSLPFTGIFVGGSAVILIALIASMTDKPLVDIPRALLVVLIIKAMVSPHSPVTAYIAVGFQGLTGALLFRFIPSFRAAALLLGVLALMESALQKLLTLTLLFGLSLWESMDAFIDYVFKKFGMLAEGVSAQGSWWVVSLYLGLYLVSGLLVGYLAGRLPAEVRVASEKLVLNFQELSTPSEAPGHGKSRSFWKRSSFRLGALVLVVFSLAYLLVPSYRNFMDPIWILLRVAGLLILWYFVLAPLLMRLLQRFLNKKASDYRQEVAAALSLQPVFRELTRTAWRDTRALSGWRRWKALVVRTITYALVYVSNENKS